MVRLIKGLVLIAAYAFLVWKIVNISHWQELKNAFLLLDAKRILCLIGVLFLMPVNWALEAKKWQLLTLRVFNISFRTALKSVLAGLSTGFITPNRIGEFGGRVLYLPSDRRAIGVALSVFSGFTQTLVLATVGIVATLFYTNRFRINLGLSNYLLLSSVVVVFFLLFYFFIPKAGAHFQKKTLPKRFRQVINAASSFKQIELLHILFVSVIRYLVFSFQFYLMLLFFGIALNALQAIVAIPTLYLLITFTPSLALSEPAIRGSYAVFVLSVFSENEIGILLSGVLVWMINFVLPMFVGSFFLVRKRS